MQNITYSIVKYSYYIAVFVAVMVLPFLLIKALVAYGHMDPESKARGRHLLVVSMQFSIVLAVLPPLTVLIYKILKPLMKTPALPASSTSVTQVNPVASGAGWVFSLLVSLLSYIVVAVERFIKVVVANITLPVIYFSEKMDQGGINSVFVSKLKVLDKIWMFFFVIAVGVIIVGFLYNYITDIMKESVGENTSKEGVNILNYINRVVVALTAAVVSYPVGKIVLWINSVLESYIASYIQFPNMSTFLNSNGTVSFASTPLTNSIAFMTLAPHTKEFLSHLNSIFRITGSVFSVFDLKQTIALGFFQSYSIFFLIAIALYFAMRIIMVVFWFGFAPVIFAVAIGYKGKINALSAWVGNFFTWALFPTIVATAIYTVSQIIYSMSQLIPNQGFGMGYTSVFALLLYGAAMVFTMRLPNVLKNVFTRMGEQFEAGAFIQGIIKRTRI